MRTLGYLLCNRHYMLVIMENTSQEALRSTVVSGLQSTIYGLQSTVYGLRSTVYGLWSTLYGLPIFIMQTFSTNWLSLNTGNIYKVNRYNY